MEESSDLEGTSVDIEPAVKENKDIGSGGNLDDNNSAEKSTNDIGKEVELKIIEDSDIVGTEQSLEKVDSLNDDSVNSNGNDQGLNGHEKEKVNDESETSAEEVNFEEGTKEEKSVIVTEGIKGLEDHHGEEKDETQINDIKDNEENKLENKTEAESVRSDTKMTESIAENGDSLQDSQVITAEQETSDANETCASIDESDISAEGSGLVCEEATGRDFEGKDEHKIETADKETNSSKSAEVSSSSVGDVQKDLCLFDDDVFSDNDQEDEQEPLKKAEVDSFISMVCEEMIQGMIDAETEFTNPEDAAQGKCITREAAVSENKIEDLCVDKFEEGAKEISDSSGVRPKETAAKTETADKTEKDVQNEKLTAENMVLQQELHEARAMLHTAQSHVRDQQAKHNQMMMSLKVQLYKTQAALKQQQNKSDKQMSEVVSHLLLLEGQLKREQCRVRREMKLKNELIENQKLEILKLREQNDQLLNAIKEIYAKGGMNGYMRDKKKGGPAPEGPESGKSGKDKKVHNGKLNTVKDKFSWKNRSSLELNNFDLEKYLIKNERLYSSHEDLHNMGKSNNSRSVSHFVEGDMRSPKRIGNEPKDRQATSPGFVSNDDIKKSPRNSQNFFYDEYSPKLELSTSVSESSQLSEQSSTSGFQSLSDHDLSNQDVSVVSNNHGNNGYDDDDDHYFSFSSTRINTVIDEEDVIGPGGPGGHMMSMGSMPLLANIKDDQYQRLRSNKDRPHSLSSVDLISIQRQAENLSHIQLENTQSEMSTPPPSPSFGQNKNELTPFQTFKTMFKRKGSKNKGHKKRSVSLSQTTSKEYTEAMKKHFQKYDMQ